MDLLGLQPNLPAVSLFRAFHYIHLRAFHYIHLRAFHYIHRLYTSPLGLFLARYLAAKINIDMICHQSLMAKQVISHHRSANVPLAILAPASSTADFKPLSGGAETDCRLFGRLGCRPGFSNPAFAAALMLVLRTSVRFENPTYAIIL